ncbi:outer membrane receptor protein involved in Fe transport [Nonomuraea thailandensis]|uniref:Outer membrane receptor protein involved in Fe transport n=1 Tax=Nonomuraea thailandensis TaxID=1188745 RepID=A0A9X2K6V4_9ACTN|nr:hypothetical protein [Nonomuraea thailandensis]MCP2362977.1 outer membrane receptor protein involved in Fe transport [Nonomuraea thailandensis]
MTSAETVRARRRRVPVLLLAAAAVAALVAAVTGAGTPARGPAFRLPATSAVLTVDAYEDVGPSSTLK